GGEKTVGFGPLDSFDDIRRIAADTHDDDHIAWLAVVSELADIDFVVGVIIAKGSDPTDVIVEGKDTKIFAKFVGGAFAKIGSEVGSIRSAAAISENKNLLVVFQRLLQALDQGSDTFFIDGVQCRFLRYDVVTDPRMHGGTVAGRLGISSGFEKGDKRTGCASQLRAKAWNYFG
ncbi:MAG: hypothetical protein JWM04_202, partial [Verrucomicrobiales bacterium]|nr:hypothetical protein [Verrucomicrobiales bacterium]